MSSIFEVPIRPPTHASGACLHHSLRCRCCAERLMNRAEPLKQDEDLARERERPPSGASALHADPPPPPPRRARPLAIANAAQDSPDRRPTTTPRQSRVPFGRRRRLPFAALGQSLEHDRILPQRGAAARPLDPTRNVVPLIRSGSICHVPVCIVTPKVEVLPIRGRLHGVKAKVGRQPPHGSRAVLGSPGDHAGHAVV